MSEQWPAPRDDERVVAANAAQQTTPAPLVFPTRVPWIAVISFVVIACALAWLVALPLWLSGEDLRNPLTGILLPVMMFTPLVSALIVVFFIQKPRPRPVAEYLGLWPLRPAKRTVWLIVFGIFGSALVVIVGVFLSAAFGLVKLDLVNFSGFAEVLHHASPATASLPIGPIVLSQLIAIPIGALLNGFVTIGEELGWRGWLLPSLRPLGTWPALVITGAVWGFWHSPIILLGYNFAQPNLFGVAMMIGGCIVYGTLIGWLRLRSASVWPSVFAHGAFNAAGGFLLVVVAANTSTNPVATGPLGWVTWIVMGAVILVLALTGQFSKQPRLVRRPRHAPVVRQSAH